MSETILKFTSDLGYWCDEWADMGDDTSYFITVLSGEYAKNKHKILPISKDDYVPQNGDKVFFLPEVNVPRIKFKNLCDESGIRTVRDLLKANVFVANSKTFSKVTKSEYSYKVETNKFKALIELKEFINNIDEHSYQNIQDSLEFYSNEYILTDRATSVLIFKYISNVTSYDENWEEFVTIKDEYQELINTISQFKIYDESTIIDQLNGEDAAVIDHDVYNQLVIMLESKDADNTILAMEIMANCKYSASLIHLMLLFYNHNYIFYNSSTKTHVNFKSLLSWLNLHPGNMQIGSEDCIEILKEKGQLNPDKLNTLLSYIGDDVANKGDTGTFKMKHITLSPELLAEMNVNYSYQMQPEFEEIVPEVEEEGPEEQDQAEEISDEDLSEAFSRMERNELKEELIALESKGDIEENKEHLDQKDSNHQELAEEAIETSLELEPVSNNHQTTQANESDDFDWF